MTRRRAAARAAMPSRAEDTVAVGFFWLAHNAGSGKVRVPAAHAGLGIAAAMVADLLLDGHITVYQSTVHPLFGHDRPPRGVAGRVWQEIAGHRPVPVSAWLWHLGDGLRDEVGAELRQQRRVHRRTTRLRRPSRWVPVEGDPTGVVEGRLRALLLHAGEGSTGDGVLCLLAERTGLLARVLDDGSETRTARHMVPGLYSQLPAMLVALLDSLESVMTNELVSGR